MRIMFTTEQINLLAQVHHDDLERSMHSAYEEATGKRSTMYRGWEQLREGERDIMRRNILGIIDSDEFQELMLAKITEYKDSPETLPIERERHRFTTPDTRGNDCYYVIERQGDRYRWCWEEPSEDAAEVSEWFDSRSKALHMAADDWETHGDGAPAIGKSLRAAAVRAEKKQKQKQEQQ